VQLLKRVEERQVFQNFEAVVNDEQSYELMPKQVEVLNTVLRRGVRENPRFETFLTLLADDIEIVVGDNVLKDADKAVGAAQSSLLFYLK